MNQYDLTFSHIVIYEKQEMMSSKNLALLYRIDKIQLAVSMRYLRDHISAGNSPEFSKEKGETLRWMVKVIYLPLK